MQITHRPDRVSATGNAEYFSGDVSLERIRDSDAPSRLNVAEVTFQPGARTAWHTHPVGQLLIVTSGEGWCQSDGGARQTIRPGDTVWFAAGERHWHGATATTAMTHLALQEAVDGSAVTWQEHVRDDDYLG